jgi:hypothetical protein
LGAAIDTRITALEALTIADLQIEWRRLYRAAPPTREDEPTLSLSHPIHLRRAGKEVRMVIDRADPFALPAKPDPSLIKAIGRAHHYYALLVKHGPGKFADLAKSEGLNRSYYSRLLRLAYLAPDITTAILDGRQPEGLTATTLSSIPTCRSAGPISDPCSALSEAASVIRQAAARRPIRIRPNSASASMPDRDIGHISAAETALLVSLTDRTPQGYPQTARSCASFAATSHDHEIQLNRYVNLAGGLGFEPRLAESEPAMKPRNPNSINMICSSRCKTGVLCCTNVQRPSPLR